MDPIENLLTRGVAEIIPTKQGLKDILKKRKVMIYQGFDPTAKSLHIGHFIGIRKLSEFQKLGHRVIFLIGDFTGMIGDPTDKSAARIKLTKNQVKKNMRGYLNQIKNIINLEGNNPVKILYNSEWLAKLTFEEIIELSSNVTVQQMIERDFFQERLKKGKPIYLHEFLYPLMQGYDSIYMNVDIELGGTDQLFNMLVGRSLMKSLKNKEKYVMCMKLLTDNSGRKMGKTEGNTINLTDSAPSMFTKIMGFPDEFIAPSIELLTDLPLDYAKGKNPLEVKKKIAYEVVRQIHQEKGAKAGLTYFENTVQKGNIPKNAKTIKFSKNKINIIDLLIQSGQVESRSKAKNLIKEGAIDVDGKKVDDTEFDLNLEKQRTIKIGKKKYIVAVKT